MGGRGPSAGGDDNAAGPRDNGGQGGKDQGKRGRSTKRERAGAVDVVQGGKAQHSTRGVEGSTVCRWRQRDGGCEGEPSSSSPPTAWRRAPNAGVSGRLTTVERAGVAARVQPHAGWRGGQPQWPPASPLAVWVTQIFLYFVQTSWIWNFGVRAMSPIPHPIGLHWRQAGLPWSRRHRGSGGSGQPAIGSTRQHRRPWRRPSRATRTLMVVGGAAGTVVTPSTHHRCYSHWRETMGGGGAAAPGRTLPSVAAVMLPREMHPPGRARRADATARTCCAARAACAGAVGRRAAIRGGGSIARWRRHRRQGQRRTEKKRGSGGALLHHASCAWVACGRRHRHPRPTSGRAPPQPAPVARPRRVATFTKRDGTGSGSGSSVAHAGGHRGAGGESTPEVDGRRPA